CPIRNTTSRSRFRHLGKGEVRGAGGILTEPYPAVGVSQHPLAAVLGAGTKDILEANPLAAIHNTLQVVSDPRGRRELLRAEGQLHHTRSAQRNVSADRHTGDRTAAFINDFNGIGCHADTPERFSSFLLTLNLLICPALRSNLSYSGPGHMAFNAGRR